MVNNTNWDRRIGKETSRKLQRWCHYTFRMRLLAKAEVMRVKVIVGTEEYTTKTCNNCFGYNEVQRETEIACVHCGAHLHRDLNGAANIYLLNR